MIPLEQIQIASPCPASWAEMTGTKQVRFCQGCRKNVYNLSAMTRDEAQALVEAKEGHLCVRFYRRADGTMLTQDCPVGLRAVRVQLAKKWSYAAALFLSCGTGLLRWSGMAQAVTTVKPGASAAKPSAKPHTARPRPAHTLGKPVVPHKAFNPAIGPDPFAAPAPQATLGEPVMGAIGEPQATMGTPVPPPPR